MSGTELTVVVEQVRPEVTYGLRAAVLRPGLAPTKVRFPGDDAPTSLHLAAYAVTDDPASDAIVGVAAVLPEALPGSMGEREAEWRLRGMAVEPSARHRGVGRALVERLLDELSSAGGGLVWCNARLPAVGFYEEVGFRRAGEPWEDPALGPHWRMVRRLSS